MQYLPLHDKVLIERLEAEQISSGGLVLPAASTNKSSRGKVLAVGPGKKLKDGTRSPLTVEVGQTVLFHEGYGVKTEKLEGKEILFLSEADILAVIQG